MKINNYKSNLINKNYKLDLGNRIYGTKKIVSSKNNNFLEKLLSNELIINSLGSIIYYGVTILGKKRIGNIILTSKRVGILSYVNYITERGQALKEYLISFSPFNINIEKKIIEIPEKIVELKPNVINVVSEVVEKNNNYDYQTVLITISVIGAVVVISLTVYSLLWYYKLTKALIEEPIASLNTVNTKISLNIDNNTISSLNNINLIDLTDNKENNIELINFSMNNIEVIKSTKVDPQIYVQKFGLNELEIEKLENISHSRLKINENEKYEMVKEIVSELIEGINIEEIINLENTESSNNNNKEEIEEDTNITKEMIVKDDNLYERLENDQELKQVVQKLGFYGLFMKGKN